VRTGENYLLVEASPGETGPVLAGELAVWRQGLDAEARAKIEARYPEMRGKVLPFSLTEEKIGSGLSTWLVLPGKLLALAGLMAVVGFNARSTAEARRAGLRQADFAVQ